jgi:SAM-dependent methyltransferase
MQATDWIDPSVTSLLDVGCNVGAWLSVCAQRFPTAHLAGVEINPSALLAAQQNVPRAELRQAGVESLPFPDESFDYVTCLEVLEHVPPDRRVEGFREMRRVLRSGGDLILAVPHAGWFAWLDSNNVRFRVPGLYRWLVGRGRRDDGYGASGREVEWHHHFTRDELLQLAGPGWLSVGVRQGGLLIFPLMDWASWPFYRLGIPDNPMRRFIERLAIWDYRMDYGSASYGIMLILRRA